MEKISSKDIPTNFEDAIKELEAIVQILEKGEASLEQSLELFKGSYPNGVLQ